MKYILILGTILFLGIIFVIMQRPSTSSLDTGYIRYVSIGDSYTIGNGLSEQERWPNILTTHLQEEGVKIELVENPAISGWTTQMATRDELPVVEQHQAQFVTILIGANDAFQSRSEEEFRTDLADLLDGTVALVPSKKILVITIPDYSQSPALAAYPADISSEQQKIERYNTIIKEEASKRHLPVADIFPISQKAASEEGMFIEDGLHPSDRQVALWESIILPEAKKLIISAQ